MARTGGTQGAHREQRNANSRFHVEGARTVESRAVATHRHPVEGTDRPHRVEVSEKQDWLSRAIQPGSDVIASIVLLQELNVGTDCPEPRRKLATAAIDRRFVSARRFKADQSLYDRHDVVDAGFGVCE
jgi:hypothetical protein